MKTNPAVRDQKSEVRISSGWKVATRWVPVLGILLASGCSPKPGADAAKKPPTPSALVTLTPATVLDVPAQLFAIGSVKASATVSVKSQQRGQLARGDFKEGDEVKTGQLLFTIDSRPFESALAQAEGNLARDRALLVRAEADMKRADELRKSDSIAQAAYDQARANVDALKATIAASEAAVSNARVQLEYCSIRAAISGRIGALLVDEGNIVRDADTVLAVINQVRPVYVDFSLPEQHLPDIRSRMKSGTLKVTASPPQRDDVRADGVLTLINNEVDTSTGTILLRATFPNDDEALWPGQFVNVALTLEVKKDAVVVPSDAVQVGQMGSYVFVAKSDQTVELRPISTGPESDGKTVVTKGLQAGEQVVTSGLLKLQNGAKFELKGAAAKPSADAKP